MMINAAILPASFILLALVIRNTHRAENRSLFRDLSWASVLWVLFLYGMTQVLSLFRALAFSQVLLGWGIFTAVLLAAFVLLRRRAKGEKPAEEKRKGPLWESEVSVLLVLIGIIAAAAFVLAAVTVPYNWDSMAYHLARLPHWVQNRSVAHYATNIERQVFSPVLAEFIAVHVYLLSGGMDRLVNFIQYFSWIFCIGGVFAISRKIGCSRGCSAAAALLFAGMPIAFAESFSTQVDLLATVWLLIFVDVILDYLNPQKHLAFEKGQVLDVLLVGICAGFGYMTKPSVCVAMAVFAAGLLAACRLRRDKAGTVLGLTCIAGVTALLLNLPEWLRMYATFGTFTSSQAGAKQLIGRKNPRYILVNFLKNFIFNLPNRIVDVGDALTKWIYDFSARIDVEINDSTISEEGRPFAMNPVGDYGQDTAINPTVLWTFLLVLALALLFFLVRSACRLKKGEKRASRRPDPTLLYGVLSVVSFVLFLAVLRWEMFETRYEISYLGLLCPLTFRLVHWLAPENAKIRAGFCGAATFLVMTDLLGMVPYHLSTTFREYWTVNERYYIWWHSEYVAQEQFTALVRERGYTEVGLKCHGGYYEYPLWVLLGDQVERLEHVAVETPTVKYMDADYAPACIYWVGPFEGESFAYAGCTYTAEDLGEDHYLLERSGPAE